jgi:hypothetical protein
MVLPRRFDLGALEHLAARDHARRQAVAELGDLAGPGAPHLVLRLAFQAVAQRLAQQAQAERLAEDVGVDRDVHHQRMPLALLGHLVELLHDHVAEVAGVLLAVRDHLRVVQLDRVGHRQDGAAARAHPHRLVVHRPVHQVLEAGFLQQVGRPGVS